MSKYNITLKENRSVEYEVECWGTEYENQATILNFIFPETINEQEISSFDKYIEFKENTNKKAEEDKAIFYDVLNNSNEYVVGSAVTFYNSINVQIVLKKTIDEATGEMVVWKSKIFTMNFCDGINASDIIDPEDPRVDLLDSLVNKVNDASNTVTTLNETVSSAEVVRQTNEETRKTNEAERQANENARQTNENARNLFEKYDATKLYVANNKVAYEGSSYVCIKNLETAGTLPTDETYWLLIAQKGEKGESTGEGGGMTEDDKNEIIDEVMTQVGNEYATTQYVDDAVTNIDLSTYATTEYVDNALGDIETLLASI